MINKIGAFFLKTVVNIVIGLFSLSCIFPIMWMVNSSLRTNSDFMSDGFALALEPYFGNIVKALQTSAFIRGFINSFILGTINVVLTVIFAFIVAYFLSRYQFRFRNVIYVLFISGMVMPTLSLLIPVFIQFKALNLSNHWYTLVLPYVAFSLPFSVIVLENYIHSIPIEMEEAAYLEGCKTHQLMGKVIFPMCSPALSIVVITAFINAWNEFPFSLVLVNDEKLRTLSLAIRMFNSEHTMDYPMFISALVISIIPIVIIYSIFAKKIMEGMTMGAVKG